jgi:hypothetical protein
MGIKSINEPDGPGRTTMLTPMSINEPLVIPQGGMPTPVIDSLSPATAVCGDADFTLYVTGSEFYNFSVIYFAGQDEPTTLNADGTLSTVVRSVLWPNPDTVQVQISNGAQLSNEMPFEFTAPAELSDSGHTRHHRGQTTHRAPHKRSGETEDDEHEERRHKPGSAGKHR